MQQYLNLATVKGRLAARSGKVSTQVPALSSAPAGKFGMAVTTLDGTTCVAGDSAEPFSIQSLSKLFGLCALLQRDAAAWEHVGWEPTDSNYGSVAELERAHGRPRNPFVNPGALVVTDRLIEHTGNAAAATIE
ncbi:MAG: glutaminase A, partial [Comamonadaceae bacterium]